jgi:hypothetical protein
MIMLVYLQGALLPCCFWLGLGTVYKLEFQYDYVMADLMRAITISVMAKRVIVDQVQVIPALPSTFPQKSWFLWSHGTWFHKCRDGGPEQFCLPVSRQVTCLIHCKNEYCSTDPHSKHCVRQYQFCVPAQLHTRSLRPHVHTAALLITLVYTSS